LPYVVLYGGECFITGTVLFWAALPPLANAAAVVALLAGAAAQAGRRLLLPAAPALAGGVLVGVAAAPPGVAPSTAWADGASLLLLLGFTVALADLSFRQALRLDARGRLLASRSQALERLNTRLEHYVPQSLRQRLRRTPERRCAWERRWLTVAFVDLAGFTSLAERTEAEVLAKVLDEYLEALAGAVERHSGELSKLMGDGVLVAFGLAPAASRRAAAVECLRFCLELPDMLSRLAHASRDRGELIDLRVRAGVASGYCTMGDWGGNGRLDFTVIGSPVNLASRLQAKAETNGLLADAATAALVERKLRLEPARWLDLRGFGRVRVHASVDRRGVSAMVPAASRDMF
jgi:class 3 adenylate cyclase